MGKSRTVTKKSTRVARTRNAGTMTESQFWLFLKVLLRERSRYWKPIALCRKLAKRKRVVSGKKCIYDYKCARCLNYFPIDQIEVHHIVPVGRLSCAEELPGYVERLFCEVEGLQVLCLECHKKVDNGKDY